jgi:hypothetical protein
MVVHAYYPLAETRAQAEALVRAGYEVDVVCLRDAGERERERYRGVEIHRLNVQLDKRGLAHQFSSYVRFGARATAKGATLHRRHQYRSVQVHNLPDFLVFCALGPKLMITAGDPRSARSDVQFFASFSDRRQILGRLVRAQGSSRAGSPITSSPSANIGGKRSSPVSVRTSAAWS